MLNLVVVSSLDLDSMNRRRPCHVYGPGVARALETPRERQMAAAAYRLQRAAILSRTGPCGSPPLARFCGDCGARPYHGGGGLDDTSRVAPTSHLWTKRAQDWLAPVLKDDVCFETEPESEQALRTQWRDAGRGASEQGK